MNAPDTGGPSTPRRRLGAGRLHIRVSTYRRPLARLVGIAAGMGLLAACGSAAAGSGGSSGSGPVKLASVTVNGSSEQVLTEADGWTLYYNTQDSATNISCTGACAGTWPPLLQTSGQPTSSSTLPGSLTTDAGGNGRQVEYDGHPLYRYSGDSGAGQSNGEGAGGIWFVVTPALGSGNSATSPSAAASAPNGY